MPWVRFTEDFDWQPRGARWMIAYKSGTVRLVNSRCAEDAVKAGKAEYTERPVHPVRLDYASR